MKRSGWSTITRLGMCVASTLILCVAGLAELPSEALSRDVRARLVQSLHTWQWGVLADDRRRDDFHRHVLEPDEPDRRAQRSPRLGRPAFPQARTQAGEPLRLPACGSSPPLSQLWSSPT